MPSIIGVLFVNFKNFYRKVYGYAKNFNKKRLICTNLTSPTKREIKNSF